MNRLYLFLGTVLAILLFLPWILNNYWLEIFILIFYYAYLWQCWNVLTGYTGNISLGHVLYVGIGAYTSTRLAIVFGLSPWAGMFIGALFAMSVGLVIGFLGFRFGLRGVYFVLITISFWWNRTFIMPCAWPEGLCPEKWGNCQAGPRPGIAPG